MNERKLFGDAGLIEVFLKKLELVETSEGGWASIYRDAATGRFWMKYYAVAGAQGGAYLLLIKLPPPATDELISIAMHSVQPDEAVAAVVRLLNEEEVEHKEFRDMLLQKLEQELQEKLPSKNERERLLQIIALTKLTDLLNLRPVVGKSREEVQEDAAYFRQVAARAAVLFEKLSA
ncbi:hypothetical protein [Pontibacter beigongshangensis]|uniref:hypothetical protein n=1 Tax=Pontibacter beigongshangensis TaxID=2574733 RepID=UPI0016503C3E|nr:hypothetical protein [Pontibacter beigongshangensis]